MEKIPNAFPPSLHEVLRLAEVVTVYLHSTGKIERFRVRSKAAYKRRLRLAYHASASRRFGASRHATRKLSHQPSPAQPCASRARRYLVPIKDSTNRFVATVPVDSAYCSHLVTRTR